MAAKTLPTLEEMLEAGVHFGHQTRKWHPRMRDFVFDAREGIHIIDLEKTYNALEAALKVIEEAAKADENIVFVGTKKQAAPLVRQKAEEANVSFITNRWPGGLISNVENVKRAIDQYKELDKQSNDEVYLESLSTKDKFQVLKQKERLGRIVAGLQHLESAPGILFIVDPRRESTAVNEARKSGIVTIGIVDTNTDPTLVDYPIPANDDAIKSLELIIDSVVKTIQSTK